MGPCLDVRAAKIDSAVAEVANRQVEERTVDQDQIKALYGQLIRLQEDAMRSQRQSNPLQMQMMQRADIVAVKAAGPQSALALDSHDEWRAMNENRP